MGGACKRSDSANKEAGHMGGIIGGTQGGRGGGGCERYAGAGYMSGIDGAEQKCRVKICSLIFLFHKLITCV